MSSDSDSDYDYREDAYEPLPVGPDGKHDVEAFLRTLNPEHQTCPPSIVTQLINARATGCLSALLERKTSHNKLDFALRVVDRPRRYGYAYPLSQAARFGFHDIVELFLRHGASPDHHLVMDRPHFHSRIEKEMLPVDYALEQALYAIEIMDHNHKKKKKYPSVDRRPSQLHKPLSEMIEWCVDSISGSAWRTLRLLGPATSRGVLEKRIFEHARNGRFTELCHMLLAVPDRVLSPTFFRAWGDDDEGQQELDLEDRRHFAKLSLRDFLVAQLAYVTARNMKRPKDYLEYEMSMLTTSLLLLEVFRRAGPQLAALVATAAEKDKENRIIGLENQVKAVLEGAGFTLESLNHSVECYPNENHLHEYYGIYPQDKYPELQFLNLPGYISRSEVLDSDFSRAIEKLCNHPYLKEWSTRKGPFMLLLMFCHPDLVETMQSMSTPSELESVDHPAKAIDPTYLAELCSVYIAEGRIIEFTAALMAVRVFLLPEPPPRPPKIDHYYVSENDSFTTTVHEHLLLALKRVLDEEISLTGENRNSESDKIVEARKLVVTSAILLTEVFEKSAEHIYWFLHSSTYKEHNRDFRMIAKDFTTLLKDLRYVYEAKDVLCVDDLECGIKTGPEAKSLSSIRPHDDLHTDTCVKGKEDVDAISKSSSKKPGMMSTTTSTESSLSSAHGDLPISKLSTRSYHSFPVVRYEDSNKVRHDLMVKRVEPGRWSEPMIRRSTYWRFFTMTKRIMKYL